MDTSRSHRFTRWITIAAALACLGVVASEAAVRAWLAARPAPQTTPVFDWTGGAGWTDRSDEKEFQWAAYVGYKADRGRWVDVTLGDGVSIQVQFMEWDEIEDGPLMAIKGHAPDFCNAANGFVLLGREAARLWDAGQRIEFDSTAFRSPTGQTVHVFKAAWMAGVGNLPLAKPGENRLARLVASFHKRAGAARVLQAAVVGAQSSDEAWEVFEREVLRECKWRE